MRWINPERAGPMRAILCCVLLALVPASASGAVDSSATNPTVESGKSVIEVGLRYNGDSIDFFGSTGATNADTVIAKLTSPAETVKLNVKGRVGPFWMNTKQYQVENVPSMYQVQGSRPVGQAVPPELAGELQLGLGSIREQLVFHILKGKEEEGDPETVFKGLVQIKEESGLYAVDDVGVIKLENGGLFKHRFEFPSAAKPGTYDVNYIFLKDGTVVGKAHDQIKIEKVGLEAFVARAAEERPVLYGIFAVIIALGTGLAVGFIFKGGTGH